MVVRRLGFALQLSVSRRADPVVRCARAVAVEREHEYVVRLGGVPTAAWPGATASAVPTGVGLRGLSTITGLLAIPTLVAESGRIQAAVL